MKQIGLAFAFIGFASSSFAENILDSLYQGRDTRERLTALSETVDRLADDMDRQIARHEERLLASNSGFILRQGGDLVVIDQKDIQAYADAIALDVLVNVDLDDADPNFELPGEVQSELVWAMNQAARDLMRQMRRAKELYPKEYKQKNKTEAGLVMTQASNSARRDFVEYITALHAKNLKGVEEDLERLKVLRDWYRANADEARRKRLGAVSESVTRGFLNDPGVYLIREDGAGWVLKYGGTSFWREGQRFFLVAVAETEAVHKGYHYYTYPVGLDIASRFEEWSEAKQKASVEACIQRGVAGPDGVMAHIWEDGPSYSVVGQYASPEEAAQANGLHPVPNHNSGGSDSWVRWTSETRKFSEAWAYCETIL
ncbi:MAG: hypothetical protein AAGD04_16650 [Pseudomonadota bacterium]